MAAPVASTRILPTGFKLRNGYQCFITFEFDLDADYWEIAVGVPGMDVGDPIETTTQQNLVFRTFSARTLVTMSPFTVTANYAATGWTNLFDIIGVEQTITIKFADDSTLAFYGFLQKYDFDPMVDGQQPTITMTIVPTNYDPYNCVEAGPVLVAHGTC